MEIKRQAMNEICIVIPLYNEEGRFPVDLFLQFLEEDDGTVFCLVNDGSKDGTGRMIRSLQDRFPERILALDLDANQGKAEAVRQGMNAAIQKFNRGFIGFFDADFSTHPSEAMTLHSRILEKPGLEYAFGSRVATLGVKIERKLYRHLIGRVIATFISNVLGLITYDTQCGAKLFRRSLAEKVFSEPFITRWLFDVEILARILGLYGRSRITEVAVEVPVRSWIEVGGSKISWSYGFKVFFDLRRIRKHYRKFLR
jgi:dolichyl-phosphate beta-glucosyltransferase